MSTVYDRIGCDSANLRKADARIAGHIRRALHDSETVLNVGAGAASYEADEAELCALEPSSEMIAQRPADAAPVVQGKAEALPFDDNSFDAVMAVLTIHHWSDQANCADRYTA